VSSPDAALEVLCRAYSLKFDDCTLMRIIVPVATVAGGLAIYANHFHLTAQQMMDQVNYFVSHGTAFAIHLLGIKF
jgi:hypothetical protein